MLSDITIVPNMPTEFGFTGEQTDPLNDLVYLRARHLNPRLGIFGSLDPFEGEMSEPLTWNGYSWVEGNTPNLTDASGMATGFTCQTPFSNILTIVNASFAEPVDYSQAGCVEDTNGPAPFGKSCGGGTGGGRGGATSWGPNARVIIEAPVGAANRIPISK